MNRKFLFIVIMLFEISLIFYILTQFSNNPYITGKFIVIEPMEKAQLVISNESKEPDSYFYEPIANINKLTYYPYYKRAVIEITNNDSLFERYNYTVKKSEGTYRIITLGDSFTQGLWVNVSENYPEILEDMLKNYSKECESYDKFEVINLGVSGYDLAFSAERLRIRGLKYNPDLLIWNVRSDDFIFVNVLWENFTKDVKFPDPANEEKKFRELWNEKTNEFIDFLKNFDEDFIKENYIIKPLEYVLTTAEKENVTVIIFGYFQNNNWDYLIEETISNYNNADFIKLGIDWNFYNQNLTIYYNKTNPHDILSDSHPNEKGHETIASKLYGYLTQNVLKC